MLVMVSKMQDYQGTSKMPDVHQDSKVKRPFQCLICRSRFGSKENLETHKLTHESDSIIQCSICTKHFDNIHSLMAHNIVHSNSRKFKCQLCDVWFKTSGNLKEHMKVHQGLIFKCSHCGKDFNKIGNLRLHEKRHTKTLKEFKCDLCARVFSQKCLLKYHMRTHNGDKPYKCTECDSAFADKSNLKKHFRIHSGEKPFSCEHCNKSFNQKSSLTCHRRTHVTFKPYECQHCEKRFGLNEELIVHLRVHGENKMFKCHVCDEEFIEHCFLKSHMRIHDLKSAGNKSVQVYKSAEINAEEPTCLMSVNGDVNVLESIILKKRKHFNGPKKEHRRVFEKYRSTPSKLSDTLLTVGEPIEIFERKDIDIETDVKEEVICEISEMSVENDFKIEIKQECTSFEEEAIPLAGVAIKMEHQGLEYGDATDECVADVYSQSFDSDSDEKPLIQRIDWSRRLKIQFGNKSAYNSMDKFKHITESPFPVVLVERLQYFPKNPNNHELTNESAFHTEFKAEPDMLHSFQDSTLDDKSHVKSALSSQNPILLYKCSHCSKKLKTWSNLIKHEQAHRSTFECPTCKLSCSDTTSLIKHIKENQNCSQKRESKLTCSMCGNGVRYKNQAALDYHVTKHTGLKPFHCDICRKSFRSKETLRQHMECHKDVSNFNCEICGRGFPNKNHLKQHQLSHTDLKPFRCDICNNFFKSHGRLYNHKKIHMKPQYSCCYCSKEFTILGNLKIHEMRHMKSELVDKFVCKICSKDFILKHDLKYHMRKHNGERPYPCPMCPSRFADISNLHKHIKVHTGDKPFRCQCGKSYNQQSSLNTHKKSHLLAAAFESFSCSHCPKKFALEEDLTQHLRSHGIDSMFKCNFCDREYEFLNHMKSHRRIHLNLKLKRNRFKWPEKNDVKNIECDNEVTESQFRT